MAVDDVISLYLGTDNLADYEQEIYSKYQEMAEREIVAKLNELLGDVFFWSMCLSFPRISRNQYSPEIRTALESIFSRISSFKAKKKTW